MSSRSNDQGRAYEYAWVLSLNKQMSKTGRVRIVDNAALAADERAWKTLNDDMRESFTRSADAGVAMLLKMEPRLTDDDGGTRVLELQPDQAGIRGDVRDIVMTCEGGSWECGLSIKNNHNAMKHSRLSHCLDFGREWYGTPCSDTYWTDVQPVFDLLKTEKAKGSLWPQLRNKAEEIYVPLLRAFMNEIRRACQADADVPRKLAGYLIGTDDYYKVTSCQSRRTTLIQPFNIQGTLSLPDQPLTLPTKILSLAFKSDSNTTVEMQLDKEWRLSFRLHSANAVVEPSLKFDIRLMEAPMSLTDIECAWEPDQEESEGLIPTL